MELKNFQVSIIPVLGVHIGSIFKDENLLQIWFSMWGIKILDIKKGLRLSPKPLIFLI